MSDFIAMPEDFDAIEEDKPVAAGLYNVRIFKAEMSEKLTRGGDQMFKLQVEFVDYPDAPGIFHNLIVPRTESKKFIKQLYKRFVQAFNVDPQTIDLGGNCFLGLECNCPVKFTTSEEYGDKNELDLLPIR